MWPGIRLKKKTDPREEALQRQLSAFITREQLDEYLKQIKSDESRRRKWNSLTKRQQLRLLRYVAEKRGKAK